jgi:hypothetical protein
LRSDREISKGAWDVRTIDTERPETEVAVIVGVDARPATG